MILDTKVNPNSLTPGFFVVENGIIDKDFVLVGNATHPLPLNQFYIIICTNYDYKIMWQESCYPTTYISKKSDYLTFGSHIDNTIAYEVQDDDVSYTYECYDDKFLKIPRNIIVMQECGLYTNLHTLSYHYFKDILMRECRDKNKMILNLSQSTYEHFGPIASYICTGIVPELWKKDEKELYTLII